MTTHDDEDELLRSVTQQNATEIFIAKQRAERELIEAKEALEVKTNALAQSLAMMRATLDSTTDGIVVTNDDGGVLDFNERYLHLWNVSPALLESRQHQILLQHIADQFADSAGFLSRVRTIYATAPPDTFDRLELQDGRIYERFSKVQFVEQRPIGRVWIFHDITEQCNIEKAMREESRVLRAARADAERLSAMKDEFLATLSHELRTPLSAILGWTHILRTTECGAADVETGLETIERNARVQTRLIEDLLDMSRITSGKVRLDIQPLQPISVIENALEALRPAADAKNIRLTKMLDPSAGPISADPNRLQQVIGNLLSNAIKFTPKGGQVQVILTLVNSHIEISIADTGVGISEEFLPYVFHRFRQADSSSTRRHGGLGIGLSIAKDLTELHGGTINVKSGGENRGATFTVALPLTVIHPPLYGQSRDHPRSANHSAHTFQPIDLSGLKVLVVDDEPDARNLVKRLLVECRAEVFAAGDSAEALRFIVRERPQVLVSDIGMPDVDGYELLRRIRALGEAQGGQLPAIALTAFARSEDRTRALRAGFLVHVAKPVEASELIATVATVVGRTGALL